MLTRILLGFGALATFASAQSSSSSSGSLLPNVSLSSSGSVVPNITSSTSLAINVTSSSSAPLFNATSSTGIIANLTSSTGAFVNITSSSGVIRNLTSSTGIIGNLTSSSGAVLPPGSSTGSAGVTRCGGAGFDLSSIANIDIYLDDGTYEWAIKPCGTVSPSLDLCDGQMCQDGTVISRYEPSLVNWYAIPNGVNLEVQNGDNGGCSGPRQSDINFICNATATTPRLVTVTEPSQCHYRAIVQTAAACTRNTTFQPGVGDDFLSSVCGGGAYDLGSLSGDITAQIGTWNWTINACGMVTNPRCASAQPVSICQHNAASVWKLADISHDVPLYEINANGLNMSMQSGANCGAVGNRTTLVTWECDATALTPRLVEAYEYYTCEYWFRVRTSVVCGAPFQIRPVSSSSGLPQVTSSSTGLPQAASSSTGLPRSSSSTGSPILGGSSSSSTGAPVFAASSSSSTGASILGSSSSTDSTGAESSVVNPPFFDSSSSSAPDFIDFSSSTAGENIEDPGVNGANMASVSSVAVIVSLMAVAMAL